MAVEHREHAAGMVIFLLGVKGTAKSSGHENDWGFLRTSQILAPTVVTSYTPRAPGANSVPTEYTPGFMWELGPGRVVCGQAVLRWFQRGMGLLKKGEWCDVAVRGRISRPGRGSWPESFVGQAGKKSILCRGNNKWEGKKGLTRRDQPRHRRRQ